MMVAARRLAAGIALAGVAASGAQAADVVLSTAQAGAHRRRRDQHHYQRHD
jgi:flagellar protein FliO/FliZ